MALVIAPTDGFDSYASIDDADDYVSKMGLSGWPDTDPNKEVALRKATQYIKAVYSPQVRYIDPVHENIRAATVEAAVKSLAGDLLTDVDASAIVSETVGPLSTTYAEPKNGGQVRFALIDALMHGLGGMSGVMMLKRI